MVLLLFFLVPKIVVAQYTEYEIKAAYLEKFSRFIEWPAPSALSDTSQAFLLGIVGKNPFDHILEEIFNDYKIKNRKVQIKYFSDPEQITSCNLLYISASEKKNISSILTKINENPILTISDTEGFADKGVHINLYVDNNYIRYEINRKALEKSGLKVSSLLLASAKIVHADE
ncbi:MAG: YfiR family protein [Bacteroidota bacterium]